MRLPGIPLVGNVIVKAATNRGKIRGNVPGDGKILNLWSAQARNTQKRQDGHPGNLKPPVNYRLQQVSHLISAWLDFFASSENRFVNDEALDHGTGVNKDVRLPKFILYTA